jgi:hypothetical protein
LVLIIWVLNTFWILILFPMNIWQSFLQFNSLPLHFWFFISLCRSLLIWYNLIVNSYFHLLNHWRPIQDVIALCLYHKMFLLCFPKVVSNCQILH